jgi:hypothetical protein
MQKKFLFRSTKAINLFHAAVNDVRILPDRCNLLKLLLVLLCILFFFCLAMSAGLALFFVTIILCPRNEVLSQI